MDNSISDRSREKFHELTEQFIDSLPEKLEHLKTVVSQVDDCANFDKVLWDRTRNDFHKVSGTCAALGFHDVSHKAQEVELFLGSCIQKKGKAKKSEKEHIGELYAEIVKNCEKIRADFSASMRRQANTVQEAAEADSRYMFLYKSDHFFSEDARDHFKIFGYSVYSIEKLEMICRFPEEGKSIALVLDAGTFQDEQESHEFLRKLCGEGKKCAEYLKVVYLCEWDNFDTRLFAVRTCGKAFIPAPFDVPRLIDKIDSLLLSREEEPYHILIINDEPEKVASYAMILQKAGMLTSVALDPRNIMSVLIESRPDLVLIELDMVECAGSEIVALIRQQEAFVGIPVVFLSAEPSPEKRLRAIQQGADDFLIEPIDPDFLTATLSVRVERTRSLRYFMERDSLTGLYNHSQLMKRLADDLSRSRRIGSQTCYAMIDIDHFKQVNDKYGHLTGDRVLKSLSQLIVERLRKTDTVGRYGGEEFGVILFNTDITAGEALMNEIRLSFSQIRHKVAKNDFIVTFSCGITEAIPEESLSAIKEQADKALYAAKHAGRNRVVRYHQ